LSAVASATAEAPEGALHRFANYTIESDEPDKL
jgi:hypothetical protein